MKVTSELVYGLAGSLFSKRFDEAKTTPECHLEWWDYCCSDEPIVAIAAPRGHAKSTSITHCYTLACLLFRDRRFVLLVSDTYEQAVLFLGEIKIELQDNEALQDLFGEITFIKDTESDIICQFEDGSKFRIMAKGSEQRVRGVRWDGMRPDLIIGDDLENDEIVLNQERREKFRHWFEGALLPARNERGIVRIVGTILHMDSLLERMMPKPWHKNVIDEGTKVYSLKKRPGWLGIKYRAHTPDFKKILWPEKWPEERLRAERERYIESGNPEGYSQEYLNEPIDDTRSYFRREDFGVMSRDDMESDKTTYIAVDFAISDKDRANYTVFIVGGVDSEHTLHILEVVRERLDAKEIIDRLFSLSQKYKPELITVEAGMIEKSLGPFLYDEMAKRDQYLMINPMVPTKDKESRARSMQARMRAGGVKFPHDADWYPDLEMEMRQFPRSPYDDQVDAMAWLGLTLDKMHRAQTPDEVAEDEWENEFFLTASLEQQGRNKYTGY